MTISEEFDDRQAVPDDAILVPQDRYLAGRGSELVALAAAISFLVVERDDDFVER